MIFQTLVAAASAYVTHNKAGVKSLASLQDFIHRNPIPLSG